MAQMCEANCGKEATVKVNSNGKDWWLCNHCYKVGKAHPRLVPVPESLKKFASGLQLDDEDE